MRVPEDQDRILQDYQRRKKYFLIIGASKYPDSRDNRPFVEGSAALVRAALLRKGYQELGYLVGDRATKASIRAALKRIQDLTEDFSVLVYYAGHAVVNNGAPGQARDLYLQVRDERVDSYNGIPVADVIKIARDQVYKGKLILLIDSCFASQSLLQPTIWSEATSNNTAVLVSSRSDQPSWPYSKANPPATAFGYFFARALHEDWVCADSIPDGGLQISEISLYIRDRLKQAFKDHAIEGEMEPDYVDQRHWSIVAYDNQRIAQGFESSPWRNSLVALSISDFAKDRVVAIEGTITVRTGLQVLVRLDAAKASSKEQIFLHLPSESTNVLSVELENRDGKVVAKDTVKLNFAGPAPARDFKIDSKVLDDLFQIDTLRFDRVRVIKELERTSPLRDKHQ